MIAASGGSSSTQSAASSQYCPDGTPKPPSGDCSGHGGKPPKHKHKKPKFHVHRHPSRGCYSGAIAFRIGVSNRPGSHRTFVYRDGHLIKVSRKNAFKVHFNVQGMRSGIHTLKLRVRGSDGKWYTRKVHFRRC